MKYLCALITLLLSACASGPVPPDWQMNAHAALNAAALAYLDGNDKLAGVEWTRGRSEIARTGRLDLLARAELTHCAVRVASLEFGACTGYDALAQDAGAVERVYAQFLEGRWAGLNAQALPAHYHSLLAAQDETQLAAALNAIEDPLARQIAAGVVMRQGRMSPASIQVATDGASSQGWRRPLLAWLGVQAERARVLHDAAELERLQRRIALVSGQR